MLRHSAVLLALLVPSISPVSRRASLVSAAGNPLMGRWDITIRTPTGERPSWLELEPSGRGIVVGRFVGIVGSARPIARVMVQSDSFHFAIPPQWEDGEADLVVDGRLTGDRLTGNMTFPDGKRFEWSGVRAPALRREHTPRWGPVIHLIHGNDLGGWHAVGGEKNQWVVVNGILRSPHSGANIVSDMTIGDFKLHIEFRYPAGSNSGVYLHGRHEVQIEDDEALSSPKDQFSGVYGFIAPNQPSTKGPNEWQSFDITLVGRLVNVVANGKHVICDQEIPGITGGAIDSKEGEPGPLLLQGDHGPIEFRNITLTTALTGR
ncbi:MAG TPA: DUF1080 domain-containing protein [Gemmatimonadaceae bacterium]|nr:DUF1080 domain-containing protein [Gemmatimonadaceae bacterium]